MSEPPVYLRGKPQYVTIYKKPNKRKPMVSQQHYQAAKIYQLPSNLYNYNQQLSTSQMGDNYATGSIGSESSQLQQQHLYAPASIVPLQTALANLGSNSSPIKQTSSAIAQLALAIPASTTSVSSTSSSDYKAPASTEQANRNYSAPSTSTATSTISSSGTTTSYNAKSKELGTSHSGLAPLINFNDYDDETGAYYLARLPSALRGSRDLAKYYTLLQRVDNEQLSSSETSNSDDEEDEESALNRDESKLNPMINVAIARKFLDDLQESEQANEDNADLDDKHRFEPKVRTKRQISYNSNYEQPCEGFPLEVNIKSRVKLNERIFPIFGKSQIKKCVKKLQLFPPVQDNPYPQPQY